MQALLVVAPTAEPYLVLALGVALTSKLQTWPQSMSLALDALQVYLYLFISIYKYIYIYIYISIV